MYCRKISAHEARRGWILATDVAAEEASGTDEFSETLSETDEFSESKREGGYPQHQDQMSRQMNSR